MDVTGTTALVTGASSGIGAALAAGLAARGAHLVLAARRTDRLGSLREEIVAAHPDLRVEVVAADLSAAGSAAALLDEVASRGTGVDVLVNDAGVGSHGDVADQDPDEAAALVGLNVTSLVELTTRALPAMVAAGRGAVLNVASTAAFQPVPTMALYAATKAFVLSYTQALHQELRGTGVVASALCPGPTETEFFSRTGASFLTRGRQSPQQVAEAALEGLSRGRRTVVPGRVNALGAALAPLAPRGLVMAVAARAVRAG